MQDYATEPFHRPFFWSSRHEGRDQVDQRNDGFHRRGGPRPRRSRRVLSMIQLVITWPPCQELSGRRPARDRARATVLNGWAGGAELRARTASAAVAPSGCAGSRADVHASRATASVRCSSEACERGVLPRQAQAPDIRFLIGVFATSRRTISASYAVIGFATLRAPSHYP